MRSPSVRAEWTQRAERRYLYIIPAANGATARPRPGPPRGGPAACRFALVRPILLLWRHRAINQPSVSVGATDKRDQGMEPLGDLPAAEAPTSIGHRMPFEPTWRSTVLRLTRKAKPAMHARTELLVGSPANTTLPDLKTHAGMEPPRGSPAATAPPALRSRTLANPHT
jgi:hypothetical protein